MLYSLWSPVTTSGGAKCGVFFPLRRRTERPVDLTEFAETLRLAGFHFSPKERPSPTMYAAVITGADHPTGLITARALKDEPIRLIGTYRHAGAPTLRSRVWHATVPISYDEDLFCRSLVQIARDQATMPVLFPSDDESVLLASRFRADLQPYYRFVYPPHSTVELLMDKLATYAWARQHDFLVIPYRLVAEVPQLEAAVEEVGLPAIIKPPVRLAAWENAMPDRKALRVDSLDELRLFLPALGRAQSRLVVQRWIPGDDADIHFVLSYHNRVGQMLGSFTGRKLLQWPVGLGSTAACCPENNPIARQIATRFFTDAGFQGLGSVEFKYDREADSYYLIEPTIGRNNLQSYIAVAAGVNLTRAAFYDACHGPPGMARQESAPRMPGEAVTAGAAQQLLAAGEEQSPGREARARLRDATDSLSAPCRHVTWVEEQKLARTLLWRLRNDSLRAAWLAVRRLKRPRIGCYFFPGDRRPGGQLLRDAARRFRAKLLGW